MPATNKIEQPTQTKPKKNELACYLAKLALYNYSIMPTITELNEMIGRIKAVQKRFGAGDGTSKVTDNSFGGRVERAKVRQHTVFFLYKNFL